MLLLFLTHSIQFFKSFNCLCLQFRNRYLEPSVYFIGIVIIAIVINYYKAGSGQLEPPDLTSKWGEVSFSGRHAWKVEVPLFESPPHFEHKSSGSSWPDLAVLGGYLLAAKLTSRLYLASSLGPFLDPERKAMVAGMVCWVSGGAGGRS